MKPSEAAVLLSTMARTDKRTVGEAESASWAEIMTDNGIQLDDALIAVRQHFGASHEYLMPIHVIDRVRAIRRDRLTRYGPPPIPGNLDQAQERAWTRLWWAAIKDGADPKDAKPAVVIDVQAHREELIRKLAESKGIPKDTRPKRKRAEYVDDPPSTGDVA